MNLFQRINFEAGNRQLKFLVIGGLAVNIHAYPRDTADLDLLVCQDARASWLELFLQLDYTVDQDANAFIQFAPPQQEAWPVDLMLVRPATFDPIFQSGIPVDMYGVKLLIPTLEHLITLKLHALKHSHAGRFMKDFLDVENMVRKNKLDLRSDNIRQLFLKYGSMELYEKISRTVANG